MSYNLFIYIIHYSFNRVLNFTLLRLNEKNFSPPLWSPQFRCRWGTRDKDDREREVRRMSETNHQQVIQFLFIYS